MKCASRKYSARRKQMLMSASKLSTGDNPGLNAPRLPFAHGRGHPFAPSWVRATVPPQIGPKAEAFDYEGIEDGQLFRTDGATLEALHTPGHTEDHVSFLLREEEVRQCFTLVFSRNVRA